MHFKPLQLISKLALWVLIKNSSTGFEILMGKLSQKNKILDTLWQTGFLTCWPVHYGVPVGQMNLKLFFCQHSSNSVSSPVHRSINRLWGFLVGSVHDAGCVAGADICLIGKRRHFQAALKFAQGNLQHNQMGLRSRWRGHFCWQALFFSPCRYLCADCFSASGCCWEPGQCSGHISQKPPLPSDPTDAPNGQAGRYMETFGISHLCT